MFVAECLLVTAPNWKEPRHLSMGTGYTELWYTQARKYCSAIKRDGLPMP